MAFIGCDTVLREVSFLSTSLQKNRVKDINLDQLKLKEINIYKKDEEITTKFEPSKDEDVVSKTYLDTKLSKKEGDISHIEKDYNEKKCIPINNLRTRL